MFKLLVSWKRHELSWISSEVKFLQALIMWFSVLLVRLTEGFRIPGNRVTLRVNEDVIDRNWDENQVDEDLFTISNAVDHEDAEISGTDSTDVLTLAKDKRNSPRNCGCPSIQTRFPLDEKDRLLGVETYPPSFYGVECDNSTKHHHSCRQGMKCTTIKHKMYILKYKVDHNEKHTAPLHHSIKKDFYWFAYVS